MPHIGLRYSVLFRYQLWLTLALSYSFTISQFSNGVSGGAMTLSIMGLFVTLVIKDTQHNSIKNHYAGCRDFYYYAECRCDEYRYDECRGASLTAGLNPRT